MQQQFMLTTFSVLNLIYVFPVMAQQGQASRGLSLSSLENINSWLSLASSALSPSMSPKFEPVLVIWPSLPKAVPERNWRLQVQNWWPSSWGSTAALWYHFGCSDKQAQTQGISKSVEVTASDCHTLLACFPVMIRCSHSCYTDSGQESKEF